MPYVQSIHQLVYATKYRQHTMVKPGRTKLFDFMRSFLIGKGCYVHEINGVEDHLHIILEIHPTLALASLVQSLKLASTDFIKKNKLFSKLMAGKQVMQHFHILLMHDII
jgi:putative transposase